jgi:CAAX prenyl protease-like protein
LGSVLVVPLAEELAFRGFLLRRLIQAEFTEVAPAQASLLAMLASSLAFGLLHQNVLGGVAAGLCFALAQRRGGLGDAALAHAVANLGVAIFALGFGRWDLWL